MKFLIYIALFSGLAFSSFCQSYSKKFSKTFNLQAGTGISASNGAFGQSFTLEPQVTFANNHSLGFEFSYKNYKWVGQNQHKLNSFLLTYEARGSGRSITPFFGARMGYFRLHQIENSELPSYGTFGGGLNSGLFMSMVSIGLEMHSYSKIQSIEGSGGVFVKVRF